MMNNLQSSAFVAKKLLNVLQGYTKGIRFLLVMFLTLTVSAEVWGQSAEVNSILWQESFTGTTTSTSTTFSVSSADAISKAAADNKGTDMFQSADITSLTYTASNVMLTASSGTNCTGAHIWLNKQTTAYFQAEGIPLYGASKVCIIWNQGGSSSITAYYKLDDGDWTSIHSTNTASKNITSPEINTTNKNTIAVKFVRTSTNTNIRLDDLRIKVTEAAPLCTKPTVSWTTAPANGNIGGSMTAEANTNYSDGLSYSSSDESVATISLTGEINYLKAGSTTITASVTGDGETYCDETVEIEQTIVVTCDKKVTITKASATGGSFKVHQGSASGAEISSGGKIDNCDANAVVVVVPSASANYTCTSVNATNSNSISEPDGSGNYTITYTKGSNISSTITVSFTENQKHSVTWKVNNIDYNVGSPTTQVYNGDKVTTLPTAPDPVNNCGEVFAGWTTTPIDGTTNTKPSVLFTTAANSPTISGETIFHAVFADYVNE